MATIIQSMPQPRPSSQKASQQHQATAAAFRPLVTPIQTYSPANALSSTWNGSYNLEQSRHHNVANRSTMSVDSNNLASRTRHFASASMTNLPTIPVVSASWDDAVMPNNQRPKSALFSDALPQQLQLSAGMPRKALSTLVNNAPTTPKATPDRYRRSKSYEPATTSGEETAVATVARLVTVKPPVMVSSSKRPKSCHPALQVGAGAGAIVPQAPVPGHEAQLHHNWNADLDKLSRSRPRSMVSLAPADFGGLSLMPDTNAVDVQRNSSGTMVQPQLQQPQQPQSQQQHQHSRNSSKDSGPSNPSNGSANSRSSSLLHSARPNSANPASLQSRHSSADVAKRFHNPSPLSKPVTMDFDSAAPVLAKQADHVQAYPRTESAAAQHLSAINDLANKSKGKTSRLRRAFSFSSTTELRRAVHNNEISAKSPVRLQKDRPDEFLDAEQERIARKQEEGGIGNNIYGRKMFGSSTDNLSISSTASSASIMIRKMGRGMKKGGRSLVGLFRPKSMIGLSDANKAAETSQPMVSVVNIEAETDATLTNILSRSAGEIPRTASPIASEAGESRGSDQSATKSIVGGDRERQESLSTMRKGILKRSVSALPSQITRSVDMPGSSESPNSSTPSTPTSDACQKRVDSVSIGNEDYFLSALRLRQGSKSANDTPTGTMKRNATFSPRIVFHDTWPSQEYDRRGEAATCNRLTPLLAQQIKEELNNFKMVGYGAARDIFL